MHTTPPQAARVYLHPAAATSPHAVRAIERLTGRTAIERLTGRTAVAHPRRRTIQLIDLAAAARRLRVLGVAS
ncbi:hypothetical protein EQG41_19630 [Billgrantia azerbaijanica]|nr:hypothetical protein EQG41_19630 [Halomonas azerbaijanica]